MEISIISDFHQLTQFIEDYKTQISTGGYGYNNARLVKMPSIYETLNKWEDKNIDALEPIQKEIFYSLKLSIEELMTIHNVKPPESFYNVSKGEWVEAKAPTMTYND
jgi:hypothetical protein